MRGPVQDRSASRDGISRTTLEALIGGRGQARPLRIRYSWRGARPGDTAVVLRVGLESTISWGCRQAPRSRMEGMGPLEL